MAYVSIVMFQVYKCVHNVEKEALKYSFTRYSSSNQQATMTISKRVMVQGVLYAVVLLYPIIIFGLHRAFFKNYTVSMLTTIFFPSQGFFNAFIYAIPSFRRMMEKRRRRRAESQQNNNNNSKLVQEDQEQDLSKRPSWLITWKITLSNHLRRRSLNLRRSKRNNGIMTGDGGINNILSQKIKSNSHNSRQEVVLHEHGHESPNNQNKVTFPKSLVHPTGEQEMDMEMIQEGGEPKNLCSSSLIEEMDIEEATKEEQSKREEESTNVVITTSKALLPSSYILDKEEQAVKSFVLSHFSELEDDHSQQHSHDKVVADEVGDIDVNDIDVIESATKNIDNESDDDDDESYIDDYLKLSEIGY